jgi:hypothetical protein
MVGTKVFWEIIVLVLSSGMAVHESVDSWCFFCFFVQEYVCLKPEGLFPILKNWYLIQESSTILNKSITLQKPLRGCGAQSARETKYYLNAIHDFRLSCTKKRP